jgi:hypothetical protein
MTAAVIVRPGGEAVLPPAPEMIRNEGTEGTYEKQKQDGERKAAARLLEKHGTYYKTLRATVPRDGLYADYGTCKTVLDQGLSFIFTGKDESHPWIAVERGVPETLKTAVWTSVRPRLYKSPLVFRAAG